MSAYVDPYQPPPSAHKPCPLCGGPTSRRYEPVSGDPGDVEPVTFCLSDPCPLGWE